MFTGLEAGPLLGLLWHILLNRLGQHALIVIGVLAVVLLAARRAGERGVSPGLLINQVLLGLLIGIPMAAQLLLTWRDPGGLTIVGQPWPPSALTTVLVILLAALLATVGLLHRQRVPLPTWLDICMPAVLLGRAIMLAVSFVHQLGQSAVQPPTTLLDELIPTLAALGALIWAERRARGLMRPGESALLCGLLYALGHIVALGLHTSLGEFAAHGLPVAADTATLCPEAPQGRCGDRHSSSQLLYLVVLTACAAKLGVRRLRLTPPPRDSRRGRTVI